MAGRVAEIPVEAGGDAGMFGGQRERGQEEFRGGVFRDHKCVGSETPPDPITPRIDPHRMPRLDSAPVSVLGR